MIPHKTHYHEASHLVFNTIIQNLCIDYPKPTYVAVENEGKGSIDGGWFLENNTFNAGKQLNDLEKKGKEAQIVEMFHLMAGYSSYSVFVNPGQKEVELGSERALNKSDFAKCDKIASIITDNNQINGSKINNDNLKILQNLEIDTIEILKEKEVKEAIVYVAKKIANEADENGSSKIENQDFIDLFSEVCRKVKDVNIQPFIDAH